MDAHEVLLEGYSRVPELIRGAVDGLTVDQLRWAPVPGANPIGWLIWHLSRVQDHHIAELLDEEQLWLAGNWAARFGLDPDPNNTGYGHSSAQVASLQAVDAGNLIAYYDAVAARTVAMLRTLTPADLDRVVDTRWDPPVTLGVRLISILDDDVQHAGQAAYVRGLLKD